MWGLIEERGRQGAEKTLGLGGRGGWMGRRGRVYGWWWWEG